MNPTQFKEKVLTLNLNQAEITRVKNISTRSFKYDLKRLLDMKKEDITDKNFKMVWSTLNKQYAKDDKFHRIQTHSMRNFFKRPFTDYSNIAYNNSSEDL